MEHLIIGKAQHPQAVLFQLKLALRIFILSISMNWPIHLDHQAGLRAVEIHNVAVNGVLAPKFQALDLPVAQKLPQFVFCLDGFNTHPPRFRF